MLIEKVDPLWILGVGDEYIRKIESAFNVQLIVRGNQVKIIGEALQVEAVEAVLNELIFLAAKNKQLTAADVETIIHVVKADYQSQIGGSPSPKITPQKQALDEVILFTKKGYVKPRTEGQRKIVEAIRSHDIVVVIGPAGTGKTYLAVALAVSALKEKTVNKIVLARPAVEAGESLGYLPGDFREKIDPYLRPLYDALEEMLPRDILRKYMEQNIIEVVPLAYMRGRTLNNAFVILDEAQNATTMQMKMFLTRLGIHSKAIINGDITQIDLPDVKNSGLIEIQEVLKDIEGIKFVFLDKKDVVRHRLVRDIIQAYDAYKK